MKTASSCSAGSTPSVSGSSVSLCHEISTSRLLAGPRRHGGRAAGRQGGRAAGRQGGRIFTMPQAWSTTARAPGVAEDHPETS
ncbi:hypothetical protein [Streptomyces sp. LN245]|uniref:hypothetical protein n=1 Tax=Streptomyces sp. LN245 TaxID=3112975 RepID=UPI00371F8277